MCYEYEQMKTTAECINTKDWCQLAKIMAKELEDIRRAKELQKEKEIDIYVKNKACKMRWINSK